MDELKIKRIMEFMRGKDIPIDLRKTLNERGEIWLRKDMPVFLEKFGSLLDNELLQIFEAYQDDYEVSFYLRKFSNANVSDPQRKNRRAQAFEKLKAEGSYFSDFEIRGRNPELFQQYIGQYLNSEELLSIETGSSGKLSNLLFNMIEIDKGNLKGRGASMKDTKPSGKSFTKGPALFGEFIDEDKKPTTGVDTLNELPLDLSREMMMKILRSEFIKGNATNIDYEGIDNDEDLDDFLDNEIQNQYFDD